MISLNTDHGSIFQTVENHYYFSQKVFATKWGLPLKNVAKPKKRLRLSMHDLDNQLSR